MNRSWYGFAGWNLAVAAGLGLAGQSWVAPDRAGAVWWGVLASFAGALAGSIPLAAEVAKAATGGGNAAAAIGKATLLRLAVTLIVGGAVAVLGNQDRRTLLGSLAVSYLALLAVETLWFLQQSRKERSPR